MELLRSTSHRGFSVRRIFTFVLTVLIAGLLWTLFSSTPTHALEPTANWKGESIIYDGHQYYDAPVVKNNTQTHGLPQGTHYYAFTETISEQPLVRKMHIIYFSPSADPPTATTANYAVYDYSADNKFSNPTNKKSIEIKPQGTANSVESSCTVSSGIGWIICPVSTFLADAMDNIFTVLSGFIAVQPPKTGDSTSDLYVAWNVMRSIANVAFIIAFLVIIYSQLTSLGISNYGLKKLIPRLIIAAVLVNVSYLVCAAAVDLSNILGYSIQDILIGIRQNTFNIDNETWSADTTTWSNIMGFVLSGGTATAAGIGLLVATGGSIGAALYLLLPILLGLILTVLFVLLILAARQAIIIILIVIAPLAFVANLLPNTEKWFEKWRDLFMTMLVFFPAFSLVFGGSQLAGGIIIQNATNIFTMIFGMAVQIAPLVITPLLLKLSGGLLGKIAGIVNDPRKGLMDRTKNWSNDRAETRRNESLGMAGTKNPFRRMAQRMDTSNRKNAQRNENAKLRGDNRWHDSDTYRSLHEDHHDAETAKTIIEQSNEKHLQHTIRTSPRMFEQQMTASVLTDEAAREKKRVETTISEAKAGANPTYGPQSRTMTDLMQRGTQVTKDNAAEAARAQAVENETQKLIAESFNVKLLPDKSNHAEFLASQTLLRIAGGVQGSVGITRAQANATTALAKIESEALDNSVKLLNAEAIMAGSTLKLHSAKIVADALKGIGNYEGSVIEAALEAQAQEGQITLVEAARESVHMDQTAVSKVIARNVPTMKSKGGFHLQADPDLNIQTYIERANGDVAVGTANFKREMNLSRIASLGDTSANNIGDLKMGWLESMVDVVNDNATIDMIMNTATDQRDPQYRTFEKYRGALKAAQANFSLALDNEQVRSTIGDRLGEVGDIRTKLDEKLGPIPPRPTAPSAPTEPTDEN